MIENKITINARLLITGTVIGLFLAFLFIGVTVIDETERGVVLNFGRYTETFEPGIHFYNDVTTSIVKIPVATQLETTRIEAGSKDLQQVNVETNVNYRANANKVGEIYSRFGRAYVETILQPRIKDTITGVTAQYVPEEMLQKREEIRSRMEKELRAKLDSADANNIVAALASAAKNHCNDRGVNGFIEEVKSINGVQVNNISTGEDNGYEIVENDGDLIMSVRDGVDWWKKCTETIAYMQR